MDICPDMQAWFDSHYIPEPNSGCWLWTGGVNRNGYAFLYDRGKKRMFPAHQFSVRAFKKQEIASGLDVDHLCRVRSCVNPDHLDVVTRKENLHRSPIWLGNRTHCPHGHPYDEENAYTRPGRRQCRACNRLYARKKRGKMEVKVYRKQRRILCPS